MLYTYNNDIIINKLYGPIKFKLNKNGTLKGPRNFVFFYF